MIMLRDLEENLQKAMITLPSIHTTKIIEFILLMMEIVYA